MRGFSVLGASRSTYEQGGHMSVVMTREVAKAPPVIPPGRRRTWTRFILPAYAGLVLVYLVLPILIMILYGFNASGFRRVSFRWARCSLFSSTDRFPRPDPTADTKTSPVTAV